MSYGNLGLATETIFTKPTTNVQHITSGPCLLPEIFTKSDTKLYIVIQINRYLFYVS